jgi:hypothetical protein
LRAAKNKNSGIRVRRWYVPSSANLHIGLKDRIIVVELGTFVAHGTPCWRTAVIAGYCDRHAARAVPRGEPEDARCAKEPLPVWWGNEPYAVLIAFNPQGLCAPPEGLKGVAILHMAGRMLGTGKE